MSRRFPTLLTRLASGELTLTAITLLAAHLTDENHEALLEAAGNASKRDIERLIAGLYSQPDIPSSLRRLAVDRSRSGAGPPEAANPMLASLSGTDGSLAAAVESHTAEALPAGAPAPAATVHVVTGSVAHELATPASPGRASNVPRPRIAPIDVDRYLLRVTISGRTRARLDRARDLLRHTIPNGDPAAVIDRALIVLVDQLERRKIGRTERPAARREPSAGQSSRHVPTWVRRAVWARDEGRCAFVGIGGRCGETGFLEYHHVIPYAHGGATNAANLELRCRAHNAYEAAVYFGGDARASGDP